LKTSNITHSTETQKTNTDKEDNRHDNVSITTSKSYLLENVKVSLLLYCNKYMWKQSI